MNILVVGAQLGNKGAESMLYIATDEVKKRFPEANVLFGTEEIYDEKNYLFEKLNYSERAKTIALGGIKGVIEIPKSFCKDIIKFIIGRRTHLGHYFDVKRKFREIDMIIDVSGFAIGIKWNKQVHKSYINNIKLAKKYHIPIYMMPQSFGPFCYDSDMEPIKRELTEVLDYPKVVYARERDGYKELVHTFDLKNVKLSMDLVLQNQGINWRNVFKSEPTIRVPKISGNHNVGIIPNKQCFNHGNREKNIEIYKKVIENLVADGYKVTIFRHSDEDLEICSLIKSLFEKNERVYLEKKEFSCLEYDQYVKQFDFVICSRFHGLVHAYRNSIPCIALGWSIKYKELVENVGEKGYSFDITDSSLNADDILLAIGKMEKNLDNEKEIIKKRVTEIQKDNCFDSILK